MNQRSPHVAPDSLQRVPTLEPRVEPIDLTSYDVPQPPRSPFLCDLRITREQLGTVVEHVSNIEYVRWLDRAAELHSDAAGYTRAQLLELNMMWFVARHEIDYLGETWLDDELVIATWVRNFAKVKSWRDYLIVRPRDQRVICRAATLWVLVDLSTRRPKRIDPAMAARFLTDR